jgi:F0F1-type ATP synthase assembly protein I
VSPDAPGLEVNAMDQPPAHRPLSAGVWAQVITTIAVVVLSLRFGGLPAAGSALYGAGVIWVTTLYASRRARVPERSVGAALQRVMVGEFIKVVGTIALFAVAARLPHMVWPALLCGFVAALVASWLPSMTGAGAGLERMGL